MDYLADTLREEYEYEARPFNPSDKADGHGLSEMDVLKAHFILSDYFLKEGESVRYGLLNWIQNTVLILRSSFTERLRLMSFSSNIVRP